MQERWLQKVRRFLDIGGESSRPGAEPVPIDVELDRVLPVIRALKSEQLNIPISIDTTKAVVAQEALEAGAHIINDITALQGDREMSDVAVEMEAGVILMHMKGHTEDDATNTIL